MVLADESEPLLDERRAQLAAADRAGDSVHDDGRAPQRAFPKDAIPNDVLRAFVRFVERDAPITNIVRPHERQRAAHRRAPKRVAVLIPNDRAGDRLVAELEECLSPREESAEALRLGGKDQSARRSAATRARRVAPGFGRRLAPGFVQCLALELVSLAIPTFPQHDELDRLLCLLEEIAALQDPQVFDLGLLGDVAPQPLEVGAVVHRRRYHEAEPPPRLHQRKPRLDEHRKDVGPPADHRSKLSAQLGAPAHLEVRWVSHDDVEELARCRAERVEFTERCARDELPRHRERLRIDVPAVELEAAARRCTRPQKLPRPHARVEDPHPNFQAQARHELTPDRLGSEVLAEPLSFGEVGAPEVIERGLAECTLDEHAGGDPNEPPPAPIAKCGTQ